MIQFFRVFVPANVLALLVSEIVLTYTCYLLATLFVLDVDPQIFLADNNGWIRIAIVVACYAVIIYFYDLYTQFRIKSKVLLFQQIGVVVGITFLLQALLSYLGGQDLILPTWLMIIGSALALILLPSWRIFYSAIALKAVGSERIVFVGTSSVVQEIVQHAVEHPEAGVVPIGYVDDAEAEHEMPGGKVLGKVLDLEKVVKACKPDRVVVEMSRYRTHLPVSQLRELDIAGVRIDDALTAYEATFGRISTRELRPSQLIFSTEFEPNPNRVTLRTMYSVAIGILAIIVASPILLVTAILVRLTSAGPVIYREQRVGEKDVPFMLYKFRSMRLSEDGKVGWDKKDSPRVTPLGRWLRRLRIDELPQLFNVLRGEMSIVGPRPERPEFVNELEERIPFYRQRHSVKPGITGWAQINLRRGDAPEDTIAKLEYDLYYIKHLAPALDAYIMLHTVKMMLLSFVKR